MPIYEYRCPNGHEFELLQRMGEAPPDACEVCGAGPVTRVFHPVPVFFKGSGFYSTDYGRRKRKAESSSSGDGDGDGTKPSEDGAKKADKPAEKSSKAADS
jgi:putative FmdB family regulatory protein